MAKLPITHRLLFFLMASTGWLKRLRAPENALGTEKASSEACLGPLSILRGVCSPDGPGNTAQGDSMRRGRLSRELSSSLQTTTHHVHAFLGLAGNFKAGMLAHAGYSISFAQWNSNKY